MRNKKNDASVFEDQLYEAISCLKSPEEVKKFLTGLCTYQEISSFAQRLQVARMLMENHVYNDIVGKTGTSTATISRVNRSLHDGNNYYNEVFDRLGVFENKKKNSEE